MSVRIMTLVFDAGGMKPVHKAVLLALADCANEDGRSVYPSVERLAIKTAWNERSVQRALSWLKSKDVAIIKVVAPATQHRPTEYAIDCAKLVKMRDENLNHIGKSRKTMKFQGCQTVTSDAQGCQGVTSEEPQGCPVVTPDEEQGCQTVTPKNPGVTHSRSRGDTVSPESSLNRQLRDKKDKRQGGEEEEKESRARTRGEAATASPPIPSTPLEAQEDPNIQIFLEATGGQFPGIQQYRVVIETVQLLGRRMPRHELVDYLTGFWAAWSGRKTRNGRHYDAYNLAWLTEWAVNGKIPAQENGNGKPESALQRAMREIEEKKGNGNGKGHKRRDRPGA